MTTGEAFGAQWSGGARDWARFMEPHYAPLYETIYDRLGVGDGTRLLDVGCGPGGATLLAAKRGARVAGLDASPDSVAAARERIPQGEFTVGDMERLPWPDGSCDVVTGFNAFSFAGDPVAALREARRVLVPGGKLGIVVFAPREESQQPKIMAAIAALAPPRAPGGPGPFALSAPGTLESIVEAAGLRAVEQGASVVVLAYATAEDACRAFLAGGTAGRALQHSGEARVLQALREVLEEFRVGAGGYRVENHFRWVIAA